MATYYIATTGSNSNPGTFASPWLTPVYAALHITGADDVVIRGGTYPGYCGSWGATYDGTPGHHVTITPYPSEPVVFSGVGRTSGDPMIQIYGDYFDILDIGIKEGAGPGLIVIGDHVTATRIRSYDNYGSGMYGYGDYNIFDDCIAYGNSMINYHGMLGSVGYGYGIGLCEGAQYGTIKNCLSYNNWGEGIDLAWTDNCTMEDCIIYDNLSVGVYLMKSRGSTVQRCLSYYTPGNALQPYATSENCILYADEGVEHPSSGNYILNNLTLGGDRGIYMSGAVMGNSLIAHNTFVEVFDRLGSSEAATVYFGAGSTSGGRFINNIIEQNDLIGTLIAHVEGSGVEFDYNNWSSTPNPAVVGAHDIVGDAKLAKAGSTAAGSLSHTYFQLLASSPCISKALDLGILTDYLGNARG